MRRMERQHSGLDELARWQLNSRDRRLAALYLPALGSLAIKGEEGRRILPGMTMLETGNTLCRKLV